MALLVERCAGRTIPEVFYQQRKRRAWSTFLSYQRTEIPDPGEDQILTQVKDALSLAREHFTTDSVLEVLFRMAITAGKKIKTEVAFSRGNLSVIHQAIACLREKAMRSRERPVWLLEMVRWERLPLRL